MSNQSLASFVSSGDSAMRSRRLSSALISGEALMTMKRECHRLAIPSTFFGYFFQIFSAVSVGRSRSAEAVKENRQKKQKLFSKKALTRTDFHAKTPPYPPDESPSSFRANPKLACFMLCVIVLLLLVKTISCTNTDLTILCIDC